MSDPGLRARKKRRTREEIAATAARLFAEHGYEQVSVRDVARAADVSEQTVYNHFPTKRALVLDRESELREALTRLVCDRPSDTTPAQAIRDEALRLVEELSVTEEVQLRGGLGYLALRSPEVRRFALEMTDRHADAIAAVLAAEPGGPPPAVAKARAMALTWVFQTITDESGRGVADGRTAAQIAAELRPVVETLLSES